MLHNIFHSKSDETVNQVTRGSSCTNQVLSSLGRGLVSGSYTYWKSMNIIKGYWKLDCRDFEKKSEPDEGGKDTCSS